MMRCVLYIGVEKNYLWLCSWYLLLCLFVLIGVVSVVFVCMLELFCFLVMFMLN